MKGIKHKIEQVKVLLNEIESELKPLLNHGNKADKQAQLDVVIKMANKLDKIDTELPPEIRNLKFKLIQEIDQYKEAEKLNIELQNTLAPFVNFRAAKRKKNKTSNSSSGPKKHFGIKVIDLIENQLIQPNTKIVKTVNGQDYEALITPNGKIKLEHNGNTTIHNSLSLAAKEIMERPINGWTWWEIQEGLTRRNLDYYRQKFIRNGK
jgi:Restriction Enzyme Adenine Methylase Associated